MNAVDEIGRQIFIGEHGQADVGARREDHRRRVAHDRRARGLVAVPSVAIFASAKSISDDGDRQPAEPSEKQPSRGLRPQGAL